MYPNGFTSTYSMIRMIIAISAMVITSTIYIHADIDSLNYSATVLEAGDIVELTLEEESRIPQFYIDNGDLIEVRFLSMPDLSVEQRVRSDGMISLPYIGDISVVDSTPNGLRLFLETMYKDHISDPTLLILLKEQSGRISQLKQIINPGERRSRQLRIQSDGFISLPLIKDCKISGLTIEGATKLIKSAYHEEKIFIEVSLTLYSSEGSVVSILGAVNTPGTFNVVRPLSILDAIALSSGTKNDASLSKVIIITVNKNNITSETVNCYKILKGKKTITPTIKPGQIVFVPRKGLALAAETAGYISDILFWRGFTVDIGQAIMNEIKDSAN